MARNCSKDVSLVIDHVDNVLTYGTTANKLALKRMFGLGSLEHDDDFARYHPTQPLYFNPVTLSLWVQCSFCWSLFLAGYLP